MLKKIEIINAKLAAISTLILITALLSGCVTNPEPSYRRDFKELRVKYDRAERYLAGHCDAGAVTESCMRARRDADAAARESAQLNRQYRRERSEYLLGRRRAARNIISIVGGVARGYNAAERRRSSRSRDENWCGTGGPMPAGSKVIC